MRPLLKKLCIATIAVMAVTGCAPMKPSEPVTTVDSVDLSRYVGTWYEIARLPAWFQRHCVDSKAVYTMLEEGRIGVHNECVTEAGDVDRADGTAKVVDPVTNAKLSVTFGNWFSRMFQRTATGNYWILALDKDYQTAMVGTSDREYLWILSRTTHMNQHTYEDLVEHAKELGYPVSDLIRDRRANP
ncbi:hypothetical protein YTPLAS18_31800 [Nitrospira sp.]|nr:hypothetical protein YTPLAS18_31800 [Nitrospira sp.]